MTVVSTPSKSGFTKFPFKPKYDKQSRRRGK